MLQRHRHLGSSCGMGSIVGRGGASFWGLQIASVTPSNSPPRPSAQRLRPARTLGFNPCLY